MHHVVEPHEAVRHLQERDEIGIIALRLIVGEQGKK